MLNGIRELWAIVISHALETATRRLPSKENPKHTQMDLEKIRARRFFEVPENGNLILACDVLDLPVEKVRNQALKAIYGATEPIKVKKTTLKGGPA